MNYTREQVNAAKAALGLDPDDTRSVSIYPDQVFIQTVARDDNGQVLIANGLVGYTETTCPIEEAPDGDA